MEYKFSVLMSVYYKENTDYLKQALESIENQTLKAAEWVLVEDGILTDELYGVINQYKEKYGNFLKIIKLRKNSGLGEALMVGVQNCSYPLIARMDTDDISRNDRFELQINEFKKDPSLDICGSHIYEFIDDINNIVSTRIVPLEDKEIKEYQKRRDSFNHMSVMFKKQSVLDSGNYETCFLMEDTLLWVKMFLNNCKGKNIDDYLVYARVGKDMYSRRGGLKYFKKYRNARKVIYKTGYISYFDYLITILIQFIVCIIPNRLREFIFKKLLHKEVQ